VVPPGESAGIMTPAERKARWGVLLHPAVQAVMILCEAK
jgi:hypothetical protein